MRTAHPLLLSRNALPLLDAALRADHAAQRDIAARHRRTASTLTPVTEVLAAQQERLGLLASAITQALRHLLEARIEVGTIETRISEGADRIGTLAAAVEEMAATSQEVSRNAAEAAGRAGDSTHKTEAGNESISSLMGDMGLLESAVKAMAEGMNQFVTFSAEINRLTLSVRDIAHQTNLLALNAAIEAARAGEVGRGFAVVADEVKKLADKSAGAATEIERVTGTMNSLSQSVGATVQDGLARLTSSNDALEIVATVIAEARGVVQDVNGRVQQIAAAASQQSQASTEMADALNSLSGSLRSVREETPQLKSHMDDIRSSLAGEAACLDAWRLPALHCEALRQQHLGWRLGCPAAMESPGIAAHALPAVPPPATTGGLADGAAAAAHLRLHQLAQEITNLIRSGDVAAAAHRLKAWDDAYAAFDTALPQPGSRA